MEKFRVYHNNKHKCRNRTEYLMITYIRKFLAEPVDMTIEQVYEWCTKTATDIEKSKGKVYFSDIHINSTIAGYPNLVTRGFGMYGRGRGTYTISVTEELTKDANNDYVVVSLPIKNDKDRKETDYY